MKSSGWSRGSTRSINRGGMMKLNAFYDEESGATIVKKDTGYYKGGYHVVDFQTGKLLPINAESLSNALCMVRQVVDLFSWINKK